MAPPVTPSPRRFLPTPKFRFQPKVSQLSSSTAIHQALSPLSQQFASTPHFASLSKKPNIEEVESPTSTPLTTRTKQNDPNATAENIDDEDDGHSRELPKSSMPDGSYFDTDSGLPPVKRRRLAHSSPEVIPRIDSIADPILLSSSPTSELERSPSPSPRSESPSRRTAPAQRNVTPADNARSAASRFRFQQFHNHIPKRASVDATCVSSERVSTSRRVFLLGTRSDTAWEEALAFKDLSPQKRDIGFISGGLASLVRQWILGTSSEALIGAGLGSKDTTFASRNHSVALITVAELHEEGCMGFSTVRAAESSNPRDSSERSRVQINWLFVNKEGYGFKEKRPLHKDDTVAVAAPIWEIEIDGLNWAVAVNWIVRENV